MNVSPSKLRWITQQDRMTRFRRQFELGLDLLRVRSLQMKIIV